ncbi:MAG: helix-turn-helix domain-containing protein [Pyrinomonadaceae bacterium]
MSLTLGEKIRQAREEQGVSISEAAEQTRISALYLESIENDDYRPLPGGIFNKGFLKSYAKHLGLDEQEALQDYAALISQQGSDVNDDPKTYRPEVLTDEGSRLGLLPTMIFAVIILGLIVWAVLAFRKNYSGDSTPTIANANVNTNANVSITPTPTPTPEISLKDSKIEIKPVTNPVWISTIVDGTKSAGIIKSDSPKVFEPKENFKLYYSKDQSENLELSINGKKIKLPSEAANSKQNSVDIEINVENANKIYQSGEITAL